MICLGIDLMGGDQAPLATVGGLEAALPLLQGDTRFCLYGREEVLVTLSPEVKKRSTLVECKEEVYFSDAPRQVLQSKAESSLLRGLADLANTETSVFLSAGHSGVLLLGALEYLGKREDIRRPAVAAPLPQIGGGQSLLLDAGLNPDCKPEYLLDFARLGNEWWQALKKGKKPSLGLINIGAEPNKGSRLYKAAFTLLQDYFGPQFKGNIEARDLFTGAADVLVCDGFSGNLMLKQAEGLHAIFRQKGLERGFAEKMDYERYGGSPLLGIRGQVVMGHGASGAEAIKNLIRAAESIGLANFGNYISSL